MGSYLAQTVSRKSGAKVFGYHVEDPERFGVIEFNKSGYALLIEGKPDHPKFNYCVTGLYFYDQRVCEFAKRVEPSERGEYESTDLNQMYLEEGALNVVTLGRGFAWFDSGTVDFLYDASDFIRVVEKCQGVKIAALEKIAFREGWITCEELLDAAEYSGKSGYGRYLRKVAGITV